MIHVCPFDAGASLSLMSLHGVSDQNASKGVRCNNVFSSRV